MVELATKASQPHGRVGPGGLAFRQYATGRLGSSVGIAFEQGGDQSTERLWCLGREFLEGRHRARLMSGELDEGIAGGEWGAPRQQLPQEATERVEIGLMSRGVERVDQLGRDAVVVLGRKP